VKLKLAEWDTDHNGKFSQEEVSAAMDELRNVQGSYHGLKHNIIKLLGVMLMFLGGMIAIVLIVVTMTNQVEISGGAEMRVPVEEGKPIGQMNAIVDRHKSAQRFLVEMTESQDSGGLEDFLDYDNVTDQWLIADIQLRKIDRISFRTSEGSFYNLGVAQIIRVDGGRSGTNDQINIITSGLDKLRLWESVGQLEVKWFNSSTMWEPVLMDKAPNSGTGRRLEQEQEEVFGEHPPRRLFTKGGTVVFVGGGGRSHGMYHGSSSGGGGSVCRGKCVVPKGTTEPCWNYCNDGACYEQHSSDGKVTTYQCKEEEDALPCPRVLA